MSGAPTLKQVPEGWTTDPEYTSYLADGEWAKVAKRCGLENPVALMCTTPESGDLYGLVWAGGRYYFTNNLAWSISEIVKPTTLDAILKKISDHNVKSIKMKLLEERKTSEDLEEKEKQEGYISLAERIRMVQENPGCLEWKKMDSD